MELYKGRPDNLEGRLPRECRVYDYLDNLEIEYFRVDHPAVDTMEACQEVDSILGATICKNLFLCNRQKTQFYLLMMPGEKPFKTKEITSQIGSARLSFASAEDMEQHLDILPGSVSVMGLMNDKEHKVQLLVDEDILKDDYVACHPCVSTSSLKIKKEDVFETFLKAVEHDYIVVTLTGEA